MITTKGGPAEALLGTLLLVSALRRHSLFEVKVPSPEGDTPVPT